MDIRPKTGVRNYAKGYEDGGEVTTTRKKKKKVHFPYEEMDYSAGGANIYTPGLSNNVPSTAAPAYEPPPSAFGEVIKTG